VGRTRRTDGAAEHTQRVLQESKFKADLDTVAVVIARQRAGGDGFLARGERP